MLTKRESLLSGEVVATIAVEANPLVDD